MTDYQGCDKLIGTLLGTIGPAVSYWEDIKSLDVQRAGQQFYLQIDREQQTYDGFGTASWKDVDVAVVLYMLQSNPLGITDDVTEEQLVQAVHDAVNQYDNSSQGDTVGGNPLVWAKITDEERLDNNRGIVAYTFTIQVRVYVQTPQGTTAGVASTSMMQLVLTFLGGLPAGSTEWSAMSASTIKSLDLQRTGNVVVVHQPTISGQVTGLGEGLAGGSYTQQQISHYTYRLTLYGLQETDVEAASDWIAANAATYFLNVSFGQGTTVMAKVTRFDQITKERGSWWRELDVMIEAVVGV
jgi:hypothetical protein